MARFSLKTKALVALLRAKADKLESHLKSLDEPATRHEVLSNKLMAPPARLVASFVLTGKMILKDFCCQELG